MATLCHRVELATQMLDLRAQQPALLRLRAALYEIVIVLVGTERHPVANRTGIRPDPREWPEEPSEEQRQQAKRVDRVLLRMVALLGDLFGQDVHEPEDDDHD